MRRSASLAAVVLLAGACTAPISTQVNVTDPAPESLRVESLAVLPPTVDPGLEVFGRDAVETLYQALREEYPSLAIVPPAQALERLQNARAAVSYANLVAEYEETGALNQELVRELGAAVGARYLLNVRLTYAGDAAEAPEAFAGRSDYEIQSLRLIAQLWDGERGLLEWRTIGDVTAMASDLMQQRNADEMLAALLPEVAELVPIQGGEGVMDVPMQRGPEDRTVFMGASGVFLLAFLLL